MQVRVAATRWSRGVRLARWLGALVLVGAACGEQSNLDPDAAVQVHGVVHDVDGGPLRDRPVRLGSGVSMSEGTVAFFSVGLFCLTGECSGDFFDTTTDTDGSFVFELTGRDTQSTFGETASFLLATSAAPSGDHPAGPAISARFNIQTTSLELPALRLVDPEPELHASAGRVAVEWDGSVAPGPYAATFADRDGSAVWEVEAAEPTTAIDGRILEDSTGLVAVSGTRTDAVEGSDLTVQWRSSSVAFRGGYGPPPSRGAECGLVGADGLVEPLDGCDLTDGSFEGAALPSFLCPPAADTSSTTGCPAATAVRIELPEPLPADLVVVRGCTGSCRVATIAPGAPAPTVIGPTGDAFGTMSLDGSPVVAVDVITEDLSDLGEVSIWSPVEERPALLPVDDPASFRSDSDRGGDGDDWPVVAVVIAAIAVLLTGIALGIVLGRRSRAQGT